MPESSPPTRHQSLELAVPYRDTRAQDLRWSLSLPVQPALATRTVRLGGLVLELRLLGASHQVLAWAEALAGDLPRATPALPDSPTHTE